jgi:hypothetical protein
LTVKASREDALRLPAVYRDRPESEELGSAQTCSTHVLNRVRMFDSCRGHLSSASLGAKQRDQDRPGTSFCGDASRASKVAPSIRGRPPIARLCPAGATCTRSGAFAPLSRGGRAGDPDEAAARLKATRSSPCRTTGPERGSPFCAFGPAPEGGLVPPPSGGRAERQSRPQGGSPRIRPRRPLRRPKRPHSRSLP